MNYNEAKHVCEQFALKHKVIFDDEGECGFGRECVGFSNGGNWIDHNPLDSGGDYEPIPGFECEGAYPPDGVNAYHKHDCLAVLGRGEDAVIQLATWVRHLEAQGTVTIEEFKTGAKGIQAMLTGTTGRAVKIAKNS